MRTPITCIALLLLVVYALADDFITPSKIYDWVTGNIGLTNTESVMVLTAGIAYETQTMLNIWDRCYSHSGYYVDGRNCFSAVRVGIIRWAIELAGLGVITGWYKRDVLDQVPYKVVEVGALTGYAINLSATNVTSLQKRNSEEFSFMVGNDTFTYAPMMLDDILDNKANLILLKHENNDDNYPVSMLEANSNGTWALNFMDIAPTIKRDGVDGDQYLSGAGGIVIECQYGGGVGDSYDNDQGWVDAVSKRQGYDQAMSATYNFYHGYIGSSSRLKCATKMYTTDQNMQTWRNWNDVWSSF